MADRSLIFPAEEYRRRVDALQRRMARAGHAALLLTSAADIFYTTGFLTRFWESPARPWFVVVPAQGAPIAVIPGIGADLMGRTWINDIRTWDAPDPLDDGVSLLIGTLREVAGAGAVGTPMGLETHARAPFATMMALLEAFELCDATAIVHRVREVKSEAEITKIRAACAVADAAFADVPEIVRGERRLDQVFRRFQMALLDHGADWVSYVAGGAGQGGYGDVISPAADMPLRAGDILMLDTGAVKDGYFGDFDRNFAISAPSDAALRVHLALHHATDAALAQLRPGMLARDAHRIMARALEDLGERPCGGRLGHGLGVTLTEWPSFTPRDVTELRDGMVLTLEPSAHVYGDCILVHEENIVLRADGPELLSTRAPRDLPVIEI
ncbi:Xaa-Pro peptidase family protein [Hasllibacter sp. MH4015]|uniref:M24 family metallopeptidase n=1 Tax=Hasllibacter sp. MH4015 TaxID=2854029 RepID=UPI001CD26534|nr:Xaa-Pro peptidase family protein [Hasllibacter sp. MH4015]